MANLTINIVTKYADAEKGFNKAAGSVSKYRNELIKANAAGKDTTQAWEKYNHAIQNGLLVIDKTKTGMASLTAQAKLLGEEMVYIRNTFGENDETYKRLDELLGTVKKDMADLEAQTSKMGKGFGDTGTKLLSVAKNILKFQLLMGPITAVVRGFRNTLSDSVKVAAEAEQVFNKLATVFDGFGDSAKKMASTLASSIGVANSTAASALSTVGDLLQAQGMGTGESLTTAAEWVRQFQDIIAFKDINMSLEEFAQNFMSGAAGNLRNFRTFGSIVKESAVNAELASKGLDKLTGSELELAKMTTRAEMALEQQKNAMGATEREWDTMLSINRRYTEAWKQFKETVGESINSVLKPIKAWWTGILEEINKATKAQAEYAKGSKNIGVYNIYDNSKDAESFGNALNALHYTEAPISNSRFMAGEYNVSKEDYLTNVNKQIVLFGATVADAAKVLGNRLTPEMRDYLEALELERKLKIQEEKDIEKRLGRIQSRTSSADSLMETIANITGASGGMDIQDISWLATMKSNVNGDSFVASWIKEYVDGNIEGALKSIDSADLKSFGDIISGELGDLDDGELLKNKAEAYKQFFEALHNYFGKDGDYSAEELATLENIKKAYASTNDEAQKYQKSIEAEAGIKGHITSAQDVLWEALQTKELTRLGIPSDQISTFIKYERAIAELREQFELLGKDTVEINGQLYTQEAAERLLIDARTKEIEAMKKEEKQVLSLSAKIANGLFGQYANTGFAQGVAGQIANSTGGQIVQAGIDGASVGGPWGAVIGVLTEILSKTESFTELLELAKPIVQIFDAFIKPIVPAVQIITSIMNDILFSVLKPLFPVIKLAAQLLGIISIPVKIASNILKNIYVAVNNILQRLLHPFTGGNRMDYVPILDGVDEIIDTVKKIGEMTFDIRENTDPNNSEILKAYNNMFQKGLITASEYQGLLADINGLNYDRMKTYKGGSWNNGGGVTNVYYGDLKFEIVGTNLSADQIAEAVTRKQKEWSKTGQYA